MLIRAIVGLGHKEQAVSRNMAAIELMGGTHWPRPALCVLGVWWPYKG